MIRAMRRGTVQISVLTCPIRRSQREATNGTVPAQHLAAARKELLAIRRGEEESDNAEASTAAHFVIWFDKKDVGLVSGIQKPSADGAASISGRRMPRSEAQFYG
jgi:hypothetical protein